MFRLSALSFVLLSGVIALNLPVNAAADTDSSTTVMNLFMDEANGDVLSLTHGGDLGLARSPEGIALLEGEAVKKGLVLSAVMRDANGETVAIATEIENFPEGQRPGVVWETYWTVYFPGVGSLYGFETESIPEEHLSLFKQRAEGEAWTGELRAKIASGPRDDGWGVIVGGTGEYEGATGKFAEFYTLRELPLDGGILGVLELEIVLDN